jgi:hypothetical protein
VGDCKYPLLPVVSAGMVGGGGPSFSGGVGAALPGVGHLPFLR